MISKKKNYIIISVCFLTVIFLSLIFIYFQFKEIQQKSNELISQKNNASLLEKEFQQMENFKREYAYYQLDLEKIDNLFIDSQNPVKFIEYLEKSASRFGIDLKISTPSFSKEGSFSFAGLQLFSSGDFSQILVFIRELETGPYLIKVQNLDMENYKDKKASEDQVNQIKATFSIKVFAKSL